MISLCPVSRLGLSGGWVCGTPWPRESPVGLVVLNRAVSRRPKPNLGSAELDVWRLHGDGASSARKEGLLDGCGLRGTLSQSLPGRVATALGHGKVK